jgi:hypothetical protein
MYEINLFGQTSNCMINFIIGDGMESHGNNQLWTFQMYM